MRPYVDYYRDNTISPVAQNVVDLGAHFARRRHLARLLGVVPALIEGGCVLEFGPGTGHNALWTLAQRPSRYDLIDANPVGLVQARKMLSPLCPATTTLSIREAFIEDTPPEPVYDLVMAEGLLPIQKDPAALLRHIAAFVKPGGVLVVTSVDGVSVLAETLRRLYSMVAVPTDFSLREQARVLAELWGPHLSTLKNMTRSHVDWVLDNILHPFEGNLFTVADVIRTLAADFDILGGSPHFFSEWRWYKDLNKDDCGANEAAIASFMANLHNFLDYRHIAPPRDSDSNGELLRLATEIFDDTRMLTPAATVADAAPVVEKIRRVRETISAALPQAGQALDDFLGVVDASGFALPPSDAFANFEGWFGRGQQYISMTRR